MKELHAHGDRCRSWEGQGLSRRRFDAELYALPRFGQRVLSLERHRCGPHCMPPDPETPVRLDWRGPDRYDRSLVRQQCGHAVSPGVAHSCSPRPGRPVLFGGLGR